MVDLDALEAALGKMTPGPWEDDREKSEGDYGDGPMCRTGYDTAVILAPNGKRLFDALNSDAGEVHEDGPDEEGFYYAWDEVSRRNAAGIVLLHNAAPALLAELRQSRDRVNVLEEALGEKR
jgi:hypothetical protein